MRPSSAGTGRKKVILLRCSLRVDSVLTADWQLPPEQLFGKILPIGSDGKRKKSIDIGSRPRSEIGRRLSAGVTPVYRNSIILRTFSLDCAESRKCALLYSLVTIGAGGMKVLPMM